MSGPRTTSAKAAPVEEGRPVTTTAGLAGMAAAVIGLVVCMSVALTGWFLADAGGHGDTVDALHVGAVAWLTGQGSHLVVSGVPLGITPLAITMVLVLIAFRSGRWAAGHAAPVEDDRSLGGAVATFGGGYVVVAVVIGVLASQAGAAPVLGRAVLGALLVSVLGGGAGLAAGSGRLRAWMDQAPAWVLDAGTGAVAAVLWLVAAGAALVAVSLLLSFNEAATVLSGLHLSVGDAVSYTVVMALFAPNAALLGAAYLLGPGFAFGAGTTVSPTAVSLGVVPAFPLLAALPDEGPTPGWLVILLAVPALAAAVGIGRVLSRQAPTGHDVAATRGALAGLAAGVLVTLLIGLSGGALGNGRMADIGAPFAEVLVFATGLMCLGGVVGAIGQNWWRRRGGWEPPVDDADEATVEVRRDTRAPVDRPDDGDEPTVEVLR